MALTPQALVTCAAQVPYASPRCPGTFGLELKDTKTLWILKLQPDVSEAYENPVGQPPPAVDCTISYKNTATFLSLHVTKVPPAPVLHDPGTA